MLREGRLESLPSQPFKHSSQTHSSFQPALRCVTIRPLLQSRSVRPPRLAKLPLKPLISRMGHRYPMPGNSIPETALECVFAYIDGASDRSAISRVCKKWCSVDSRTRKDVIIACSYAIDPSSLTRRFKALEAVKLKGKPRAAMFKLIPDDWGGYAKPWVSEIAVNCPCLKSIHLRRMIVTDEDLFKIAKERGHVLQVLKLDKCSNFSTTGLEAITRFCRSLRVLFLDESYIEDRGGKWLHELALHNSSLEVLNFSGTELQNISMDDLLAIAANCKSLISLRLNESELGSLTELLRRTTALQELGGFAVGSSNGVDQLQNSTIRLPPSLTSLVRLLYMGADEGDITVNSIIQPIASGLKNLDLQCAFLSVDGHCQLLQHCSNLQALEVFNAIGDEGLEVIANNCRSLRRLRVERGDKDVQQGFVTQKGLISVALNCHYLEYIAVYVTDINNAALVTFAHNCPKLKDFRLVLLDEDNDVLEYPLDEGVRALMQGCPEMHRFALYLRHGFLTDSGMAQIGKYGQQLKWVLFGLLGESDMGLSLFADGCPKLERLEIRDCVFSEAAIASSALKMDSLKYIWVQGYKSTDGGKDLLPLNHALWNVEFMPGIEEPKGEASGYFSLSHEKQAAQFIAYRSLVGRRTDYPQTVVCV